MASAAVSFTFDAALSPSLGRGGSFGESLDGAACLAFCGALLAADCGVLVADFAAPLGESALVDWPNLEVWLDAGFLPALVGVFGGPVGALPAAGDGAMLLDVFAV